MSIVINLIGSPNSGKSTLAMHLTSFFKERGVNSEYVPEFVKDAVYDRNKEVIRDQLFILANQNRRIIQLKRNEVSLIVTDSPLILSSIYSRYNQAFPYNLNSFHNLVLDIFNSYNNVNLLLKKSDKIQYSQSGRIHDNQQAMEIDGMIKSSLSDNKIPYIDLDGKEFNEIPLLIIEEITKNSQNFRLTTNELIGFSQLYTAIYNEREREKFKENLLKIHIKKAREEQEKRKKKMTNQYYLFHDKISSLLRKTREKENMSVEELADTFEMTPEHLSELELGYPRTKDEDVIIRAYVNNYIY